VVLANIFRDRLTLEFIYYRLDS